MRFTSISHGGQSRHSQAWGGFHADTTARAVWDWQRPLECSLSQDKTLAERGDTGPLGPSPALPFCPRPTPGFAFRNTFTARKTSFFGAYLPQSLQNTEAALSLRQRKTAGRDPAAGPARVDA